ncbi:MAG: hypothetical protein ACXVP0_18615 [Bacteroidia bacterium]
MTAEEYLNLDFKNRETMLWQNGSFIDSVIENGKTFHLFFMKWFYAEVVISHQEQRITEITAFSKGEALDKYLENVQLYDLL